ELVFGAVVLVATPGFDIGDRDGGQEGFLVAYALQRRLEGRDVSLHRVPPCVGNRSGADDAQRWHRRRCRRPARRLRVELWERLQLARARLRPRGALLRRRLGFEARQPLADVGHETRLALLAVVNGGDAPFRLSRHHVHDGLADAGLEGRRVVRLAAGARREHVEEVRRTRQAADVGGEDALCAQLHAVTSYLVARGNR